ncbi:MAG: hypothetical protein HC769_10455 [Cyanobacteria bacterium CRU_2_1]|nr:hypothetical protein [Cyanobacteria bacterium RU_5_0]NJR59226.1 hypothetical protein [Cyanobacteria bacterium CRU_2_1]
MSDSRLPASIRYLKARLSVLRRPMVWGAASILLFAVFLLSEYWNQLEQFAQDESSASSLKTNNPSQFTPLDPPFSVTEDTLPDLFNLDAMVNPNDLNAIDPVSLPPLLTPESSTGSTTEPSTFFNPFVSSRQDTPQHLDLSGVQGLLPTSRILTPPELSSPNPAQPSSLTAVSPLQAALDRNANLSSSRQSIASTTPDPSFSPDSTPLTIPGTNESLPPTTNPQPSYSPELPQQIYPELTVPQPIYIPRTSPPPGTTGYTLPPVLAPTITSSSDNSDSLNLIQPQPLPGVQAPPQVNLSTPAPQVNQGFYSPNVQVQTPQTEPPPFSTPRTAPGTYIGGGEINTFSNP